MHQIEHYELTEPRTVGMSLRAGCVVRVGHGRLWLTRPGHALDLWLHAGESWTLPTTGTVWLSAETTAQFQLAQVVLPWPGLSQLRQLLPAWLRGRSWPSSSVQIRGMKDRFIAI